MIIRLSEYAKAKGKNKANARRLAIDGRLKTAFKDGYHWFVDDTEPWPDDRLKTGKYIGWRKNIKKNKKER